MRRAALAAALWWPLVAGAVESSDTDAALNDDDDFVQGVKAMRGGAFAPALQRFERALRRHPEAAELHSVVGYSHRKLRQFDKAFEHYKRALAIEPRHRGAHEYIGEAYLEVGDLASAQRHLAALREICLLPCDEMKELAAAIDAYRSARPTRP